MTEYVMTKTIVSGKYDLEERTYKFAKRVALYCKKIKRMSFTDDYSRQLARSSSSVGANYIEANEALSKRDFRMRIKICRKEAKESGYWINLIMDVDQEIDQCELRALLNESIELKKIFSSIVEKSK